jgi:hypothetical protein
MAIDRRWLWVGGILAVAGGALALGVSLATLLTLAAVLACPAAMYFGMCGMGMKGRMQEGADTKGPVSSDGRGAGTATALPPAAAGTTMAPSHASSTPTLSPLPLIDDPVTILKRRLASGEISLDDYDRLLAAVSRPDPARSSPAPGQGTSG